MNLPFTIFVSRLSNLEDEMGCEIYTPMLKALQSGDMFPATFVEGHGLSRQVISSPGIGILEVSGLSKSGLRTIQTYLDEFPAELEFSQTGADYAASCTEETRSGLLSMFAGQLCYQSFRDGARTTTDELGAYLQHVISSKPPHGALFEHVNVSVLIYGIPRSISHEIVRHRAGWGFSQVSTRYIPPRNLRLCVRREIMNAPKAWEAWKADAATAIDRYDAVMTGLGETLQVDLPRTDRLKQLRQAARDSLPHYTETAMVLTGNIRAWRNLIDHRANPLADSYFSELAFKAFCLLLFRVPQFFADYTPVLRKDVFGLVRAGVQTDNPKV